MDKEKLDELWRQVEYIGTIDHFDDSRMLALGSVFGEMRAEIENLFKQNKRYREALEYYAKHAINDSLAQDVLEDDKNE